MLLEKKKLRRKDKMQKIFSLSSKNIQSVKKTNRCVVIVRNCKLCTIVKSCRLNFYPVKNCCEIFPSLYLYQIIIISTMYKNKIRIFFSFSFLSNIIILFAIYYSPSRTSFRIETDRIEDCATKL